MRVIVERFLRRWYLSIVIFLWVFTPEVRRIIDWQVGFSFLPVINLVPLVALLPAFVSVKSSWRGAGAAYRGLTILWLVGFGYALVVALETRSYFASVYDAVQFLLPIGFGLMMARGQNLQVAYNRLARTVLVAGVLTAAYGIYQYVSPPPWDVFWVQNAGLISVGVPVPFEMRSFGTLNSPGPFSDFLDIAILMNLAQFRKINMFSVAALAIMVIAIILSLVRTEWIGLALGVVTYLVVSPRRAAALGSFAIIGIIGVVFIGTLMAVVPDARYAALAVTDRFSTFDSLSDDPSQLGRQVETADAIDVVRTEPLGVGLGSVGTSAKLGAAGAVDALDNGYLSRYVEMGVIGGTIYVIAIIGGLVVTFRARRNAGAAHDPQRSQILAACVAIQVVLTWFDVSSDHHLGFMGVFFWMSLAIVSMSLEGDALLARTDTRRIVTSSTQGMRFV